MISQQRLSFGERNKNVTNARVKRRFRSLSPASEYDRLRVNIIRIIYYMLEVNGLQ